MYFRHNFSAIAKQAWELKLLVGKRQVGFFSTLHEGVLGQIYAPLFLLAREKRRTLEKTLRDL